MPMAVSAHQFPSSSDRAADFVVANPPVFTVPPSFIPANPVCRGQSFCRRAGAMRRRTHSSMPQVIPFEQAIPGLEPIDLPGLAGIRINPAPGLGRRQPRQILMRAHMVVPTAELAHQPRQHVARIHLQLIELLFQRAEQKWPRNSEQRYKWKLWA